MASFEKNMVIALGVSTLLMLFNIFAVTSGLADPLYTMLSQMLGRS